MSLFKTTEELAGFLPGVNSILNIAKVEPVLMDVQRDVFEPYCGPGLIQALDDAYNADSYTEPSPKDATLLEYIRPALAPIAMARYIPLGEVQIDGRGITVFDDGESRKGADGAQIVRLRSGLLTMGMNALERLLGFLEANVADYPLHQAILDARPRTLLPNARTFSECYQIFDSHMTYRGLLPLIVQNEEDRIEPMLDGLYAEILANAEGLSAEKKKLRRQAQRALAYYTIADAIELNMAVELHAEGLRLNYTSQIGNVKYYQPPDARTRESLLAAARSKAISLLDRLAESVAAVGGDTSAGGGLINNTGLKIVGF